MLEICVTTIEQAIQAELAGANRIEFCQNLAVGGITPNLSDIVKIKNSIKIPVHVLIRYRAGNFNYTAHEITMMIEQIKFCKKNHIDGVVIGCLNNDHEIELDQLNQLIAAADGMYITFHKAFDEIENKQKALDILIENNINAVLTSGGKGPALKHCDVLLELITYSENRISILVGGSVRANNIFQIINHTGILEYHSAAISQDYFNIHEIEEMKLILKKYEP